jgi:hypothetical protein
VTAALGAFEEELTGPRRQAAVERLRRQIRK